MIKNAEKIQETQNFSCPYSSFYLKYVIGFRGDTSLPNSIKLL